MAHFAEIDQKNIVIKVIVVSNLELLVDNVENEEKGINFCKSVFGENTRWVQTSYNSNFRKQFAGKDFFYDSIKDKFIVPQPYSSWILDQNDEWQAPIPRPETYNLGLKNENNEPIKDPYRWDESTLSWILLDNI
jgi:hypothetical protein